MKIKLITEMKYDSRAFRIKGELRWSNHSYAYYSTGSLYLVVFDNGESKRIGVIDGKFEYPTNRMMDEGFNTKPIMVKEMHVVAERWLQQYMGDDFPWCDSSWGSQAAFKATEEAAAKAAKEAAAKAAEEAAAKAAKKAEEAAAKAAKEAAARKEFARNCTRISRTYGVDFTLVLRSFKGNEEQVKVFATSLASAIDSKAFYNKNAFDINAFTDRRITRQVIRDEIHRLGINICDVDPLHIAKYILACLEAGKIIKHFEA